MAGELADEERVPIGAVVDAPGVGGAVEERLHLGDREALDGHALDVAVAPQVCDRSQKRRPDRIGIAVGAEHHQPVAGGPARDSRQERQGVAVGEMEVVERE